MNATEQATALALGMLYCALAQPKPERAVEGDDAGEGESQDSACRLGRFSGGRIVEYRIGLYDEKHALIGYKADTFWSLTKKA